MLRGCTPALIVSILALLLAGFGNLVAVNNNRAACSWRQDVQERYEAGRQFIAAHPKGIPGITRAELDRSLLIQKRTLESLDGLRCF